MIKKIKFKDRIIPYNTESGDGFEEILHFYDRKIRTMVSGWVKNIPDHDVDDLSQVCREKLIDALENYDDESNINFSTYVYTAWKRKLSQLSYKYKTKKYSGYIENDNYISFNYAFDKLTNSFYLMLGKHKCPISKKVITPTTCQGCEFSCGLVNKEIGQGSLEGETRKFAKCAYFRKVLELRGVRSISLNDGGQKRTNRMSGKGNEYSSISRVLADKSTKDNENELLSDIRKVCKNMDDETFIILQLILDGLNKSEIIKKLKITSSKLDKKIRSLNANKKLKNLLFN